MIEDPSFITLKEDTHQYFDRDGKEYKSVSSLISLVKPKFDRDGISARMAEKEAKLKGISVKQAQEQIIAGWEKKRDNAADTGTDIHNELEMFMKVGQCKKSVYPAARSVSRFIRRHYKNYPEMVVHSKIHGVAGTVDLPVQRTRSKSSVIDIYDYKTNVERGIEFDTSKYNDKKEWEKFYNRFLIAPLDHLEASNYNMYSIQMSLYAVMIQMLTGRKIGSLGIIFIDYRTMVTTFYPVPYMKMEALALLDYSKDLKALPTDGSWQLD